MGFFKNVGNALKKAVKDTKNATVKAVKDTGHVTGKVVTSKVGQAVIGGALAATGVGAPAAIAIGAASKGVGNLIKPGGNLKSAATGAYQGAAVGAGAAVVGSAARAIHSGTGLGGFKSALLRGKNAIPAKATISGPPPVVVEPEYAVEAIVPGVTDSGEIKHDATDRLPPIQDSHPLIKRSPKDTPTDVFTPFKRHLLGSGEPSKQPGEDASENVAPVVRFRENPATMLPVSEPQEIAPAPVATSSGGAGGVLKDNLPMLLAVGAAGVVMLVVLGRQVRK